MQNDKSKFKDEFKRRIYRYALEAIKFIDELPKEKTSETIGNQLLCTDIPFFKIKRRCLLDKSNRNFHSVVSSELIKIIFVVLNTY